MYPSDSYPNWWFVSELWFISRSVIYIQMYDMYPSDSYPNWWFVSRTVIRIQNCYSYPNLWFISKYVLCIQNCDSYTGLWVVSKFVTCVQISWIHIQIYDLHPHLGFISKCVILIQTCDSYPELWFISKVSSRMIRNPRVHSKHTPKRSMNPRSCQAVLIFSPQKTSPLASSLTGLALRRHSERQVWGGRIWET